MPSNASRSIPLRDPFSDGVLHNVRIALTHSGPPYLDPSKGAEKALRRMEVRSVEHIIRIYEMFQDVLKAKKNMAPQIVMKAQVLRDAGKCLSIPDALVHDMFRVLEGKTVAEATPWNDFVQALVRNLGHKRKEYVSEVKMIWGTFAIEKVKGDHKSELLFKDVGFLMQIPEPEGNEVIRLLYDMIDAGTIVHEDILTSTSSSNPSLPSVAHQSPGSMSGGFSSNIRPHNRYPRPLTNLRIEEAPALHTPPPGVPAPSEYRPRPGDWRCKLCLSWNPRGCSECRGRSCNGRKVEDTMEDCTYEGGASAGVDYTHGLRDTSKRAWSGRPRSQHLFEKYHSMPAQCASLFRKQNPRLHTSDRNSFTIISSQLYLHDKVYSPRPYGTWHGPVPSYITFSTLMKHFIGSRANFCTLSYPPSSSPTLKNTNSQTSLANPILNACTANLLPKHPLGPRPNANVGPAMLSNDPSGLSQRSGEKSEMPSSGHSGVRRCVSEDVTPES